MVKYIAIANQKGGVGKTTTTLNLATALALQGFKVLAVDLDSQGNLSHYLGFKCSPDSYTINSLMYTVANNQRITYDDFKACVYHSEVNGIDYIPADISLAQAEYYLINAMSRESVLKWILQDNCKGYDYVLIDCLPSLGVLFVNALAVSNSVIIPVQTQEFAMLGLNELENLIAVTRERLNPNLEILGVLPTMTDNTRISKEILAQLHEKYQGKVFNTAIKRSVVALNSVKEKSSLCLTNNVLGEAYKELAVEVIQRGDVQC
jgi:chromosome partitioning protein